MQKSDLSPLLKLKTSGRLSGIVGALSSVTIEHNIEKPSGYILAGGWTGLTGHPNLLLRAFTETTVSVANCGNSEINFNSFEITLLFVRTKFI